MKHNKLYLYIIGFAFGIGVFGLISWCNTKEPEEQIVQKTTETAINQQEISVESEVVQSEQTHNKPEEVKKAIKIEQEESEILTSPEHAIKNEEKDTYTFTEEFLNACQTYHFFSNSTHEEIADFLGGHWSTLIDRTLSDGIVVFETVITNEKFIKDYGNELGQLDIEKVRKIIAENNKQNEQVEKEEKLQPEQNNTVERVENQNKPQNQPVSDNKETNENFGDGSFFNKPEGWDENVGNIISDVTIH